MGQCNTTQCNSIQFNSNQHTTQHNTTQHNKHSTCFIHFIHLCLPVLVHLPCFIVIVLLVRHASCVVVFYEILESYHHLRVREGRGRKAGSKKGSEEGKDEGMVGGRGREERRNGSSWTINTVINSCHILTSHSIIISYCGGLI
jgi:hypothetical protein